MQRKALGWLVAIALFLIAGRAHAEHAEHAPAGGAHTFDSAGSRYHVALIVADVTAAVLGAGALYAMDGSEHDASRAAVIGFGTGAAGTFLLGAPLVHLGNGHVGRAGASLGIRALGLLAGAGTIYLADKGVEALHDRDCPDIGERGSGSCALGTVGLAFGLALASTVALIAAFGGPVAFDHRAVSF